MSPRITEARRAMPPPKRCPALVPNQTGPITAVALWLSLSLPTPPTPTTQTRTMSLSLLQRAQGVRSAKGAGHTRADRNTRKVMPGTPLHSYLVPKASPLIRPPWQLL